MVRSILKQNMDCQFNFNCCDIWMFIIEVVLLLSIVSMAFVRKEGYGKWILVGRIFFS